jgi:hypothetical protein
MLDLDAFPPIELLAQEQLKRELPGAHVYSSVPKTLTRNSYPLITLRRIGGVPVVRERLDRAALQIDVWANNKTEALETAAAARRVLMRMEGQVFQQADDWPTDAFVTAVEDDLGLTFLEDHVTGKDRYLFGISVYAHS